MDVVNWQGQLPPLSADFAKADVAYDEPQDADEDDDADTNGPDNGIGHLHLYPYGDGGLSEGVKQWLGF